MKRDEMLRRLMTELMARAVVGERLPRAVQVTIAFDNRKLMEWRGDDAVQVASRIAQSILTSPEGFPAPVEYTSCADCPEREGCDGCADDDGTRH